METFVVRVWRAADPDSVAPNAWKPPLRGLVEHVGTGVAARFGGGEELLRFLQDAPTPVDSTTAGDSASSGKGDPR